MIDQPTHLCPIVLLATLPKCSYKEFTMINITSINTVDYFGNGHILKLTFVLVLACILTKHWLNSTWNMIQSAQDENQLDGCQWRHWSWQQFWYFGLQYLQIISVIVLSKLSSTTKTPYGIAHSYSTKHPQMYLNPIMMMHV